MTTACCQKGQAAIDAGRWDRAVRGLRRQWRAENGAHADGALYWKAYALNKMGRRAEALARAGAVAQGIRQ